MACACVEKLQSICLRLKGAVCGRSTTFGRSKRRPVKISDPFDFQHVSSTPPGFDQDEMNVLREKAAASRLVAIEDQPPTRRPSSPAMSYFMNNAANNHSQIGFIPSSNKPPQVVKSRAGYRGLASSANRGLPYAGLTESRPSITQSFAAIDDSITSLSPTGSISGASSSSSSSSRQDKESIASSI